MTNEQKPREFLEYPMVIDWLQWSDEFKEELGKPDMPQVTLTLISEMKAKISKLEKENEELKEERDHWKRCFYILQDAKNEQPKD